MNSLLYRIVRDLHLYAGLFISPFVLLFAVSVFFIVEAWVPKSENANPPVRTVLNLPLPADLDRLSGRARIDALKPALHTAGVDGEVGWVQHLPKESQLIVPVTIPGRLTTVRIDLSKREAAIEERNTGWADATVMLHKSPGPHLVGMRMNWSYMRFWFWFSDATVYLLLFITTSGLYLWWALKAERKLGWALLATGALCFFTLVYALVH